MNASDNVDKGICSRLNIFIKTHHYIIFIVRHSTSGIESYCWSSTSFSMVGLWWHKQSGVAELLIVRDPHYGRMWFKSVKTLGALHAYLWKKPWPLPSPQLRIQSSLDFILYIFEKMTAFDDVDKDISLKLNI